MTKDEFLNELKKININLTEQEQLQLEKFYELLIEWNNKINLTRITEKKDVYLKHFYDSLTITKVVNLNNVETLCDVGTGAGFPGIVLKICYPNLKIILIDSLNKRVNYLNEIIKSLELKDIQAVHSRSEDYQGKFDIVTSRAVASLEKLIPYTHHLIKKDGMLIAMKANIDEEIEKSKPILKKYHCQINKIENFMLPKEESIRNLVCIKRV